ncbi:nucleic acid-binding, OB-fold protein [Tanacetum coccineum]
MTATIAPALVKQLREETGAGMMDCKKALAETEGDLVKAQEYLRKKGLASADKKASRATAEGRIGSYIHDSRIGVLVEVNCETDFVSRGDIFKELVNDLAMQVAACPQVEVLSPEDVPQETIEKEKAIEMQKEDLMSKPEQFRSKIVEGRIKKRLDELALLEQAYIKNDKVVVKDYIKSTIATIGENIKVKRFVRFNLGEGLEKRTQDFAAEVAAQTTAKKASAPTTEPQPAATEPVTVDDFKSFNPNYLFKAPKVAISAALVKQLREETGAGMMDCKKALSETGGDLEKAQEYLRKKGLSTADKKSSRIAAEGRIGSYIHDSRIGVLIEVNCETDFVGRSEKFKELVDDMAMQVVACPKVEYVSVEDIPESIVTKEKDIEMQREDILSKPEAIRGKIVEGRVAKRLGELALLEQPFLKDDSVLVKDYVKQTVAAIGENIKVRRFIRFTLGE